MREGLDNVMNLKLEVATYFGKPRAFFDCLVTPGKDGDAHVYQFIKRLYSQVESLRLLNSVPSAAMSPAQKNAAISNQNVKA